jgi:hypothetical protein
MCMHGRAGAARGPAARASGCGAVHISRVHVPITCDSVCVRVFGVCTNTRVRYACANVCRGYNSVRNNGQRVSIVADTRNI